MSEKSGEGNGGMLEQFSGATRLHIIVGDPIAQVKSPFGVTQAFAALGQDAICLPMHVAPDDLSLWFDAITHTQNVDGLIITVPHKFAAAKHCKTLSGRAQFLGAVNTLRRNSDGSWHGDMFDGLAFVEALQKRGCTLAGQRALLVGAGGAGTAIAHALVLAGVASLSLYDSDAQRQNALIERLQAMRSCAVGTGSADPSGFDLVLNATPLGMKPTDPLPIDASKLTASQFCGCVITQPAPSPWLAAARHQGCATSSGLDMFERVRALMVDFLVSQSA